MAQKQVNALLKMRLLSKRCAQMFARPFSYSTPVSSSNPARDLAEQLSPNSNPFPSDEPTPSRPPNIPADSRNPSLHGYPGASPQAEKKATADAPNPMPRLPPSRSGAIIARQKAIQRERNEAHDDRRRQVEKQMVRPWMDGDVYAPHDLSPAEQQKTKYLQSGRGRSAGKWNRNTRSQRKPDVFDELAIDPMKEYKNFSLLSDFVTETGRIRHSSLTGLRAVNQRRMAKAVRRAVGLGLIPSAYHHPELMDERIEERSMKRNDRPRR